MSAPKPPDGLAAPGRAFWRDTLATYELRSDERVVLDKACRTLDDLARLEVELADAPLTTVGSAGQLRAHPLLGEVRGMRALLATLLRQLDLPEVQADGAWRTATSERKRRAALTRWNRVKGLEDSG